ncbi:GNAT family N-acetyltransferase [Tateyamaria sp. syn59]|uniref:GNAT family N-acetyltransferase n=1 Tax=Tateyamaria sp. syn59 TaxID=2576942 RepID=UPI00167994B1|nr:GNAT family N-acetyltransferase [Tateyamaria sp. syn59]
MSHVRAFHSTVDAVAREKKYLQSVEAPPLGSTRDFVRKNIDNDFTHLVAVDGDAVVGWCDILPHSAAVRRHIGVLGIGVLQTYRGHGLGRALLSRALADVSTQRFAKIELRVRASNTAACHLYRSMGFQVEGTLRDDIRVNGVSDSTYCMALFPDGAAA